MTASKTAANYGQPLTGLPAQLAANPIDQAVAGGIQTGFSGVAPPLTGQDGTDPTTATDGEERPQGNEPMPGMGFLLETDDGTAFDFTHNLNLRQEMLARNRLAQDAHWTYVLSGYPFSRLEKNDNQQTLRQTFPPGYTALVHASVPNKSADLCNKYVEVLLADPPKPDPLPDTDSETAEQAASLAGRFLRQDGGEAGTSDDNTFWYQVQRATSTASAFNHYWIDPTGGGSIPLQIKAHPFAQSPAQPLVGVNPQTGQSDPEPTTDYILRYVTEDGQFTDNPADAARQWLPAIRIDRLGREHVRIFPEHVDVDRAQKVLLLSFCTIGEGKRRWPTVAALTSEQLSELCDWTPPRYLALLPPALRARWKQATGAARDVEGGANDERLFFFYQLYVKADTDYPRGASCCVSGAFGGFLVGRDTLSARITRPAQDRQDATVTDIRIRTIPVVQITLVQDPKGQDPTGEALVARFAGAGEAGAQLMSAYMEAIDITLHPARFFPSTSPVEGTDIDNSRATGEPVIVLSKDDYPQYEQAPPMPANTLQVAQWLYDQSDLIAGLRGSIQNAGQSADLSGVSRKVEIRQALQSLSRSQQAVNAAYQRHWRIKCQLAMASFSAPQQLAYVGEDGSYKQEWWTGNDFALVAEDVRIQAGTGTMMSPQDKVQYVAAMRGYGFMTPDEALDAARPTFAGTLGLPDDPHVQRLERQVGSWLEGPPEGWAQQAQAFDVVQQQNAAAQQQFEQAQQQYQMAYQNTVIADGGAPPVGLGPESQNAEAMQRYQAAVLALRFSPLGPPPQPPVPAPLPPLWTPFAALPVDDLPQVAQVRLRRLGKVMAQVRFAAQPPRWQQELVSAFQRSRQVLALAQQPPHTTSPEHAAALPPSRHRPHQLGGGNGGEQQNPNVAGEPGGRSAAA